MTMNNEDPILSPENQTQQALMRAASVKDGREAALWAVAAAVFSLRDTVERATTPPAMVDPGQLTPEEIESIRRGPVGYVPVVEPVFRPAVTREQVAIAIAAGVGSLCVQSKGSCLANSRCQCARQTNAVMKLLEGGE
jgi:hypothetical protein